MAKLDRKNCFLPPTLNRSSSVKHGLAKLLTFYFTARDCPLSKPHGPWPTGVGGPWNPKWLNLPYLTRYRVHIVFKKAKGCFPSFFILDFWVRKLPVYAKKTVMNCSLSIRRLRLGVWKSYLGKLLKDYPRWSFIVTGSSANLFLKPMSERGGSDIKTTLNLNNAIFNQFWVDLENHHSFSELFYVGTASLRHWFPKWNGSGLNYS